MSRYSRYLDDDSERLPSGMTRVGYDADEQVYTYRDADGSLWEGNPGNRYGELHRVSGPTVGPDLDDSTDAAATSPFLLNHDEEGGQGNRLNSRRSPGGGGDENVSWRQHYMPLLNFFFIVCLFLIGLIWFLHVSVGGSREGGASVRVECGDGWDERKVVKGDTCWDIANGVGTSVEGLLVGNEGLDCDHLKPGMQICVPRQ